MRIVTTQGYMGLGVGSPGDMLWIWDGIKILTQAAPQGGADAREYSKFTHMWYYPDLLKSRAWRGRFDAEKEVVSVARPNQMLEIPPELTVLLKRTFPGAKIQVF